MCDTKPLTNWLTAAVVAIVATIALIGVAIAYNGSFFGAWASPAWMIGAAGATAFAILMCTKALAALDALCACLRPNCAGECGNLRRAINAIRVVLGIQAGAALVAAVKAWIPWFGQGDMYAIIGALTLQIPLLISALAFAGRLQRCADHPPGEVGGTSGTFEH